MEERTFDVLVVGASLGGVAAALRASAMGASVCLLEASEWIGGQYSSQGLTRGDETEYIAGGTGCTALYAQFRANAVAYYTSSFALSATGKALHPFQPGAVDARYATNLRVGPRVAHLVLAQMLRATAPAVTVLTGMRAHSVESNGSRVAAVIARPYDGAPVRFAASYVLDATDLGEVLVLADAPHAIGAEARTEFGEPAAPDAAHPEWIQPITLPVAVERRPAGENHTIPKPLGYDEIVRAKPFAMEFGAGGVFRATGGDSLFNYRQFVAAANFADPSLRYDVTTLNDVSNDYREEGFPTGDPARDQSVLLAARARSLAYVYWLQTACPRDDGTGNGYPNVRVATEVFGTPDGVAPLPYVRESRRIKARKTVRQQDIVVGDAPRATLFPDACGIGWYRLDMHTLLNGMPDYEGRQPAHFQIPLGALVPADGTENLLPACKNLGVTHITNSAYRVHPIEWNIGEAAGALAAFCVKHAMTPSTVLEAPQLHVFQDALLAAGVPLYWWSDLPPADAALFRAAHLLGARGYLTRPASLAFGAADIVGPLEHAEIERAVGGSSLPWPSTTMTRADVAAWLVAHLQL
ncbi:MAG TPA: FAD-dependent oxidoreductase [Candidatus Sulfotelmatobacter sp.]|nr:FAD-dependent oxidoreductase [Candidatus Sulfotelmatobacter sp.]